VDDSRILNAPWPPDLDPETVPFRVRTVTILRRKGIWDDMTHLDEISEADVLSWMTAGVKTVADLRETGNAAIAAHHASAPERRRQAAESRRIADKLRTLAGEPWTAQVWWRDPRFRDLLPRGDVTVREICLNGSSEERRHLWGNLADLEVRVERLAASPLGEAVAGYVEAISGQHGIRLEVLLAYTGLSGRDPIMGREAGAILGVSYQRSSRSRRSCIGTATVPDRRAASGCRRSTPRSPRVGLTGTRHSGWERSGCSSGGDATSPRIVRGLRGLAAVSGETRIVADAPT
jgi:hypothetical protein